jgi:hypothetical protein
MLAKDCKMCRKYLFLFVLLFTPTRSLAQRYGRPYTLAENRELYLEIKVQNKSRYFCSSDLRKMQRSVVTLTDPTTNTSHAYEGVALDLLVPTALALEGEIIQIEFGSHQTLIIPGIDLDSGAKLIVIDTVDGKLLSGRVPFYFVEKCGDKSLKKITDVRSITVKSSQ